MRPPVVTPRRTPLSPVMAPIRRGSTFDDGGAFRGIDIALVERLRTEDPNAARALRQILTPRALRTGETEWCLWLEEYTPSEIGQSAFLSERVTRVRDRRRTDIPPWLVAKNRQPRERYAAFRPILPAGCQLLAFGQYNPDIIVNDQVWNVGSDDAIVTQAMLSSRVFRVWVEIVGERSPNGDIAITRDAVYNTFPCPPVSRRQRVAIEDAFIGVLQAREHVPTRSLDELYSRAELPRPLQAAHDELDRIIDRVFGVRPSMTQEEVTEVLLTRYSELSADDAA